VMHQLLAYSGIALAFVVLLAVVLGWVVAGRVLRPLRSITTATQRITAHNLHQRLALPGPNDELKALADTLAWLVVESGGPVLDERDVRELAQPFRRLGGDRTSTGNGTGLGLSIAAAHDGTLQLSARADGGLRAAVTLPAVAAMALAGVAG
jgi:HAMP domain-containing protein